MSETVRFEMQAIGMPVLDLKPVLSEFLPRSELRQPARAGELRVGYWKPGEA